MVRSNNTQFFCLFYNISTVATYFKFVQFFFIHPVYRLFKNLYPQICFPMEYSTEKLPFSNILLCKKENNLYTDIYYKTTDISISAL